MIGKTISHSKVLEKIGQGGMGEVYRSEDANLGREVAIKVLPEHFTRDPQRLARFEREAKLLAALKHPNIAAIYGLEEADGVRFLALELVPGETLAEHVATGPLPVEEALEVFRQIAEADVEPATVTPTGVIRAIRSAGRKLAIFVSLAAVACMTGGIAISTLTAASSAAPQLPERDVITLPPTPPLGNYPGRNLVISPDGRHITYAVGSLGTGGQLYLRALDELKSTPIPGTEGLWYSPFFSFDSKFIAFVTDGKLKKISVSGGPPVTLCEVSGQWGGSWGPEDLIVFASEEGLYRLSAAGGEPESLAILDRDKGEIQYRMPDILPGGKEVLFTILRENSSQIAVLSLETGEKKIVVEGGKEARYAPTGHLVYEAPGTGTLMAVAFDLERQEIMGEPVPVLEGVRERQEGAVDYSFSDDGTLVYIPARSTENTLVWVDRQGRYQPLTEMQRAFDSPRLSPDGRRVAVTIGTATRGNIWIYDRGTLTPLTFEGFNTSPVWTPDGKRVTFASNRVGPWNVFWKLWDGTGEAEQLFPSPEDQIPSSWSPDGVLAYTHGTGLGRDVWVLPLEGERRPREFFATQFLDRNPVFSPDGRWMALISIRSGQTEIYVKPYPGPGGVVQISTDGGNEPRWAPDGRELFYRKGDKMMAVSIQTEPNFEAGPPRLLFERAYAQNHVGSLSNYDVDSEGRFLMIKEGEAGQAQIKVVLNWFEELKRLVPPD